MQKYAKQILTIIILGLVFFVASRPKQAMGPINRPATNYPLPTTTLFFAGDIMLSRNVAGKIIETKDNILPFRQVQAVTEGADIAFANLESPFLDNPPFAQQGLIFKADPSAIQGLQSAGFDILSTANNHAFDQGRDGIAYTIDWLTQNNILPLGTGANCHQGQIIAKNSLNFGFLAYSYTAYNDGGKIKDPLVCDWNDGDKVASDIASLKPKVDFLIVSTHMGTEYKRTPDAGNANLARAAIDNGADLVIGHHPHWIQTTEQYQGKWIFYSLGNFVFDQMWSQDTKEGLTVQLDFENKTLSKILLRPVIIENYCCPRWANDDEISTILNKINLTDQVLMNNN